MNRKDRKVRKVKVSFFYANFAFFAVNNKGLLVNG